MQNAILDLLKNKNKYPQFKDVIADHFKLKKDDIIKACEKWVEKAIDVNKPKYMTVYDEIKKELNKV